MYTKLLRSFGWEIAASLLLGVPAGVLAEPDDDRGWFIEAGLLDVDASRDVSGFIVDGAETGWSFGAGYAFNAKLALQASYHDLGEGHFATSCPPPDICPIQNFDRVDLDGVSFSALGRWPITPRIDVYGKVGIMSWDSDFQSFALDESGEDLLYGLGLGVNLTPAWQLNLKYEAFGFDVDTAGIGISRRF